MSCRAVRTWMGNSGRRGGLRLSARHGDRALSGRRGGGRRSPAGGRSPRGRPEKELRDREPARGDRQYRTAAVVNAKPDGCTLLVNAAVLATFPSSFSKLGFDPVKDLAPVGGIGVTPTLLVAPKSLPADDLKGLVQLSRQRPDGLSFSTAGYGLLQHLAVEEMAQRTGGKFVHVVYKGGAQAATDLIAARVDFGSFAAGSVIQFVKGGELKPLAVVQPTRSDLMPEVATIAEQGLPGLDAGAHFMLYAPAATPPDVISLLNGELNKIVGDPALKARFASIGYDPTALSPDAAAAIMRKTGEAWAPLIKRLNIKLD